MKKIRTVFILCLSTLFFSYKISAQTAYDDILLETLQKQIDSLYHSFSPSQEVYFLSFRVDKCENFTLSSYCGSTVDQQHTQQSLLTVQIRVGNTKVDNFYPIDDSAHEKSAYSRVVALPIDDNVSSISKILALETERAYHEAYMRYLKVLSVTTAGFSNEKSIGDYMLNIPVTYYEPPINNYNFPLNETIQLLNACSGAVVPDPSVACQSDLFFTIKRKYIVSSEGTSVVENNVHTNLKMSVSSHTDKGIPIFLTKTYDTEYPDELPSKEDLTREVQALESTITLSSATEVSESTVCPVVFSGQAAAVLWQKSIVPYLSNYTGTTDIPLLPETVSVVSDPTYKQFENTHLSGSYHYDDEGTPGSPTMLIENGRIHDGLYTCESSRRMHPTNGHGRSVVGAFAQPTPANMFVLTPQSCSTSELRTMMCEEMKKNGCNFGYWVNEMTLDEHGKLIPSLVSKIYADHRPDETVCGLYFDGTPAMLLNHVMAVGGETYCAELCDHGVHYHCCSPAVLLRQVESYKQDNSQHSPSLTKFVFDGGQMEQAEHLSDIIFSVMEDEMNTALSQLSIENKLPPYYISYLVTEAKTYQVKSTLGSLLLASEKPVRGVETQVLLGSNLQNSGRLIPERNCIPIFPHENNYNNIKRCLSQETDKAFKTARSQMSEKTQMIRLLGDSVSVNQAQDRISAWVVNMEKYEQPTQGVLDQLQIFTNNLSAEFSGYPFLTRSEVCADAFHGTVFFKSTDGVQYAHPISIFRIRLWAETKDANGQWLSDHQDFYFRTLSEIEEDSTLHTHIVDLAERLRIYQSAPLIEKSYCGPVLLTNEAAAQLFALAFTETTPNLIQEDNPIRLQTASEFHKRTTLSLENKIDKPIINRSLDVDALNTIDHYDGTTLIGYFDVDADGIQSEKKRELIRNGELTAMLTTRMSSGKSGQSNGHLRTALLDGRIVATPGAGVLELSCNHKMEEKKLRKVLRNKSAAMGYKHAYILLKITPAEKGFLVFAEQVNNLTGKTTPVRWNLSMETNISVFEQLTVVSKQKKAYNFMGDILHSEPEDTLKGVPQSFILPNTLFFNRLNLMKISQQ